MLANNLTVADVMILFALNEAIEPGDQSRGIKLYDLVPASGQLLPEIEMRLPMLLEAQYLETYSPGIRITGDGRGACKAQIILAEAIPEEESELEFDRSDAIESIGKKLDGLSDTDLEAIKVFVEGIHSSRTDLESTPSLFAAPVSDDNAPVDEAS